MIRRSVVGDIPNIMEVYESAKRFMRSRGNLTQWVGGYPSEEVIRKDIANGNHYVEVNMDDGAIDMVFSFIMGEDPTYVSIEGGEWLNDEPYGTIHRIASMGRHAGALKRCIEFCSDKINNIRIDTHCDNAPMLKAVSENGFIRCGIIHLADGSPRIAFHRYNATSGEKMSSEIESKMISMGDDSQARQLMRFFKCGKGEYGEGDRFLGLRVPQTRAIVREYRATATLQDAIELVKSPWHEVRLAGFLFMAEIYRREKKLSGGATRKVVESYISSLDRANNWDLVDLSAAYILGDWLLTHRDERAILDRLSDMEGRLWHQRVAIVATWMLIRNGEFADTFRIAEKYLSHTHDLIHKATGWMLREAGKRGGEAELCRFLDLYAPSMPRTMLRYAIEKFPAERRHHYMTLRQS